MNNVSSAKCVQQRFLLLHNDACCAVFEFKNLSNIYIILSPSATYTYLYCEGKELKHLTRFMPSKFQPMLVKMINFRNLYARKPFSCKRFFKTCFDNQHSGCVNIGDINLQASYQNWRYVYNTDNKIGIYMCPLMRRICLISERYVDDDNNCLEYKISCSAAAKSVCSVAQFFPIDRIPNSIAGCLDKAGCKKFGTGIDLSDVCSNDSAALATDIFSNIAAEMSLLGASSDIYPSSCIQSGNTGAISALDKAVMVEYVNGDVYLMSNAPYCSSRQLLIQKLFIHSSSNNTFSDSDGITQGSEIEVEVWIPSLSHQFDATTVSTSTITTSEYDDIRISGDIITVAERLTQFHGSGCYQVKSNSTTHSVKRDDEDAVAYRDVILRLKGDYFTVYITVATSSEESSDDIHDNNRAAATAAATSVVKEVSFHTSCLQFELQRQATTLYEQEEKEILVDSSVGNITTTKSSLSPQLVPPSVNSVVRRYLKQAIKLLRYRDYLLNTYGERALIAASNQRITSQNYSNSGYATATNIATTTTANDDYEPIVSRETSDGTRYTALFKLCTVEEALKYQQIGYHNQHYRHHYHISQQQQPLPSPSPLSSQQPTSSLHSSLPQQQQSCVTVVRAVFNDRTILRFDTHTQCFTIMLADDGTERYFSLQTYLQQMNDGDDEYVGTVSSSANNNNSRVNRYVRQLLTFYRWAVVPASQRDALVLQDEQIDRIARAAALTTHRHLLIQRMTTGGGGSNSNNKKTSSGHKPPLTYMEAFQQSRDYERSLDLQQQQQYSPHSSRIERYSTVDTTMMTPVRNNNWSNYTSSNSRSRSGGGDSSDPVVHTSKSLQSPQQNKIPDNSMSTNPCYNTPSLFNKVQKQQYNISPSTSNNACNNISNNITNNNGLKNLDNNASSASSSRWTSYSTLSSIANTISGSSSSSSSIMYNYDPTAAKVVVDPTCLPNESYAESSVADRCTGIVSPATPHSSHDHNNNMIRTHEGQRLIHEQSDRIAGEYLYNNLRMSSTFQSFSTPIHKKSNNSAFISPCSSNSSSNDEQKRLNDVAIADVDDHSLWLRRYYSCNNSEDNSIKYFNNSRNITTAHYLSATYVVTAMEASDKVMSSNAAFLQRCQQQKQQQSN